jgi:hypothetical protein
MHDASLRRQRRTGGRVKSPNLKNHQNTQSCVDHSNIATAPSAAAA